MYLNGYGVSKENKKAFEMFLDAYNRGEKKVSTLQLGITHYHGFRFVIANGKVLLKVMHDSVGNLNNNFYFLVK